MRTTVAAFCPTAGAVGARAVAHGPAASGGGSGREREFHSGFGHDESSGVRGDGRGRR
jgi:hypothetical protein